MTDVEYHHLPGTGTNDDNGYVVIIDGGEPIMAFVNPDRGGIEALVSEIINPAPPPPEPVTITYADFRARWTVDEMRRLSDAEDDAPREVRWKIRDYVRTATAANQVTPTGEGAEEARRLFVELGVLTEERAAKIFA